MTGELFDQHLVANAFVALSMLAFLSKFQMSKFGRPDLGKQSGFKTGWKFSRLLVLVPPPPSLIS